ncbi:hypothetical protein CVD28_00615 [Bacillus sp. M6-12]|nr:hypothetical protein CVD28_00615 [Bacillus sp. M6-12]
MVTPYAVSYYLNHGNPYHQYMVNKYIPPYIEEQGYTKEDIEMAGYIEPKYLINRDYLHGHYEVVFKDELDITYFYGVEKWNHKVKQFCERDTLRPDGVIDITKGNTKHLEKDCINSMDNRD